ncbi:glycoside hydrolase family 15 protein [Streptacidiphilus sp. PB12-B1b]|uniref:glycoside hydrolase family 15 protein n=1 Tax=Streptacidiphilus sp. PB12-B1b TaxID=2705012 RepID=UPI0015F824C6|nr:glycoside hydrolase family 15 protein [Streptacidiphilus sp. PB12-B1b]QMU78519.1 glycoside hydrolase family 15 protein [Streptacidiphilus sp. PB12-B1b]
MPGRIEDYALIGDLQTAALVGRDGSVDWLCLPRFDSPSCFGALLGGDEQGNWRLAPQGAELCSSRGYQGDSLVLETLWETPTGTVRVIDFMPQRDRTPDVVRIVEGVSGSVPMRGELRLRFDYARVVPWVRRTDHHRVAVAGPDSVWLRSDPGVHTFGEKLATVSEFTVNAGDRVRFVLSWLPSHHTHPPRQDAERSLRETLEQWQEWASTLRYQGPYREAVLRSLVILKGLTYEPTGGMVAAATAALPEQIGGERNWDYRFCWLRDSTMTLSALLGGGFLSEAAAWRGWLLRAIAGDPADLQTMYGVAGERRLPEVVADWLPGYEGSVPVRFGNAAVDQLQLDVYGEVVDTLYLAMESGIPMERHVWGIVRALMDFLERNWSEPDEGLWEVRGGRRHFVHSKVMCWVAFDRAVRMAEASGLPAPVERWRTVRDTIHAEVCEKGYNPEIGAFTQYYGGTELDAATLFVVKTGFLPPDDPRAVGTVEAVRTRLDQGGFILRYTTGQAEDSMVDGLQGEEGAFLACSFWLADALVAIGRREEGRQLFERVAAIANDLGMISEEWDPHEGRQLGNTPQAFTHVALVNTAFRLAEGG